MKARGTAAGVRGRLDQVGMHELDRRRTQHLEHAREQPALVAVRDLGTAHRLERLTVAAPERSARDPYRRLEQERMLHRLIMARAAASRYVAGAAGN